MCNRWMLFLTTVLCLMIGTHAYAKDCHVEIKDLSELTSVSLLSPINFNYQIIYDSDCSLQVLKFEQSFRKCHEPNLQLEDIDGVQSANIKIECIYTHYGYFYTPPVQFSVTDSDDNEVLVAPDNREIEVFAANNDSEDSLGYAWIHWLQRSSWPFTVCLVVLLVCICGLGYHFYRKKQLKEEVILQAKKSSPLNLFLEETKKLEDWMPKTIEEYQKYHDKLSQCLRIYISSRFEVDALKLTTNQLVEKISKYDVDSGYGNELRRLLGASDRVKYARDVPSQDNNLKLLRDARELVTGLEAQKTDELSEP